MRVEEPVGISSDVTQPGNQDFVSLDVLLPSNSSSAEKKLFFTSSSTVFSGRYDPAAVCGMLMTLEENDLRDLREQLHAASCSAVTAVAGRPLSRRVSGNTSALADDCWALGFSVSQGVLTQRADSNTLKPAGRDPLPPPGPIRPSAPVSTPSPDATASMEAIIAMQLRLECEVSELRRSKQSLEGRLKAVECESARLREECTARDTRIAQLVTLVEELLDRDTVPAPLQAENDTPGTEVSESQDRPDQTAAVPEVDSAPPSRPEPSIAAARLSRPESSLATEIAAGIDLRALGGAIASALQWRVGDSDDDSESELTAPTADPLRCRRGSADPSQCAPAQLSSVRPTAAAPHSSPPTGSEPAAPIGSAARPYRVTGTGASSDLVMGSVTRPAPPTRKFILEGFRLDASDRDVSDLVRSAVCNLHGFHSLPRQDGLSKAYMIEVGADEETRVMNPSTWPAGLTVRLKSTYRQRRKRSFRASQRTSPNRGSTVRQTAEPPRHRMPEEGGEWSRAAPSTAAERRQHEAGQHSEATTGYPQEHGEWQLATNRRRRRGRNYAGNGAGRTQQAHWSQRSDNQRWLQPDYRCL